MFAIRQVRAVFVMALLGISSFAFLLSALPVWAVHVGVAEGLAGTVTTVLLVATVAVQIVCPALLRRVSPRLLMVIGLVLMGAPSPFYLLAHDLASLYLVSILRGAGFALVAVVGALAIQQAAPRERQGEAVGVYGLAAAIPTMFGVAVGAGLTLSGWFGVVAWIGAAPLLGLLAAPGMAGGLLPHDDGDGNLGAAAMVRRLVPPLGLLFAATAVGGGVLTLVPLELTDGPLVTSALLVFGALTATARWWIGRHTDRRGHRGVPQVLVTVGVVGLVLLALGLRGPSWPLVFVGGGLAGIAYGALQSTSLDIAFSRLGPGQAPTASAAWNAFFDAGTATGAAALVAMAAGPLGGAGSVAVAAGVFVAAGVLFTITAIPGGQRVA